MNLRRLAVWTISPLAILATSYGIYSAIHSPLFLVRVVEVADQPDDSPVDADTILRLAAVDAGKVSLFDLNLPEIEQRILTQPWIRDVRLEKRFPQTLSISVNYRQPKAIFQTERGQLIYVDSDGHLFGSVSLLYRPDLPLFSGMEHDSGKVTQALEILKKWESARTSLFSQISGIDFDEDRGFRALISYSLHSRGERQNSDGHLLPSHSARSMVDLGTEPLREPAQIETQIDRLGKVLEYLSNNSISAHQIWADAGKKIVVKTAHGS